MPKIICLIIFLSLNVQAQTNTETPQAHPSSARATKKRAVKLTPKPPTALGTTTSKELGPSNPKAMEAISPKESSSGTEPTTSQNSGQETLGKATPQDSGLTTPKELGSIAPPELGSIAPTKDLGTIAPAKPLTTTQFYRSLSQYTGNIHFSPVSTWLPLKYGLALGYVVNERWTVEAELTQKILSAGLFGVDFGQITDRRYGVQGRWYPTDASFNVVMGLFKSEFSFELGSTLINRIPNLPSSTVWRAESLGPQLGLGNRWQWKSGVHFGIDWLLMYYPMFAKQTHDDIIKAVTNQSDLSDLDRATSFIRDKPQFDLLRFTLGYSF